MTLEETQKKIELANILINERNYEKAIILLNDLDSKLPKNFGIKMNLGACYKGIKKYEEAINFYLQAKEIKDSDNYLFLNLGNLFLEMKNYEESIDYYKQSLSIDPDDLDSSIGLAATFFAMKEYKKSYKIYSKIFAQNKNRYEIIEGLGVSLLYQEKFKESQPFLEKAYEMRSQEFNARKSLSTLYHMLGKKNKAVEINRFSDGAIVFFNDERPYQII